MVRAGHARLAARIYAVCVVLFGCAPIGLAAFLVAVFGLKSSNWRLFVFVVLPGLVFIALGPLIWRQRTWAMIAALALAVAFRYVLSNPTPAIGVGLIAVPVLFAALTAVDLMADGADKTA